MACSGTFNLEILIDVAGRRQKEKQAQRHSRQKSSCSVDQVLELRPKETHKPEIEPSDALRADGAVSRRESGSLSTGLIQNITLQTSPPSLPGEPGLYMNNYDQTYHTDRSRFYPLPILKSRKFFPNIDYSLPNDLLDSGINFASGPYNIDGAGGKYFSDTDLTSQNNTFEIPERDEISKSALDCLDPALTSATITSNHLPVEVDSWRDPTTITSLSQTTSALPPRRTNVPDDSVAWDATLPLIVRNTCLEDIIAAGMQVLLFNRPSPSSAQNRTASSTFPSFVLPSPYLNVLDIPRTRTLAACVHNARSMGFTISDVIKPHYIAPSLFYQPHSPDDDPVALLASVSDPKMPANLRPTLPQVLYPHPAFLDLIPLPAFRTRVILDAVKRGWANLGIDGFDLFELKRDIFQDGLAWDSYDGHGRQWAKVEPWDITSWKASGWFVKKWKGLVDDIVYVSP